MLKLRKPCLLVVALTLTFAGAAGAHDPEAQAAALAPELSKQSVESELERVLGEELPASTDEAQDDDLGCLLREATKPPSMSPLHGFDCGPVQNECRSCSGGKIKSCDVQWCFSNDSLWHKHTLFCTSCGLFC